MDGLFGGLFDFNRDGSTDLFEMGTGLAMLDEMTREEEKRRTQKDRQADDEKEKNS